MRRDAVMAIMFAELKKLELAAAAKPIGRGDFQHGMAQGYRLAISDVQAEADREARRFGPKLALKSFR